VRAWAIVLGRAKPQTEHVACAVPLNVLGVRSAYTRQYEVKGGGKPIRLRHRPKGDGAGYKIDRQQRAGERRPVQCAEEIYLPEVAAAVS
jgi:hypothetical protein